jgi:Na+-transporting methylmalonyl-CoA/oxaloacetate decarboxylase gamma subunit
MARRPDERASGLLSTVIGVAVVLGMLGLAVNVMLGLWVRSTVDAVAYDAARRVATAPADADRDAAAVAALADARRVLGAHARRVELRFESLDDPVRLHVRSPGVELLPAMVDGAPTVGAIDRRIVMHAESP